MFSGDNDNDGISIAANALSFELLARLTILAGNAATLGTPAVMNAASLKVDTSAPTVMSFNPADGASGVSDSANLTLTFSELMELGTGEILILEQETPQLIDPFLSIGISNGVGSGGDGSASLTTTTNGVSDLVIEHNELFTSGSTYFVNTVDGGEGGSLSHLLTDLAGNPWVRISDQTTWNFTVL